MTESAANPPRWTLPRLFTFTGEVQRLEYLVTGVVLFSLKYAWEYTLATVGFRQSWSLAYYFAPWQPRVDMTDAVMTRLYLTALVFSLPFIWIGVAMTARRLRSAGLPLWLTVLFFAPIINLFFFVALSFIPSRRDRNARSSDEIAQLAHGSDFLVLRGPISNTAAIIISALLGTGLSFFDVYVMGVYGFGLFVGLPFALGAIAALISGMGGRRSAGVCVGVGLLSIMTTGTILLLVKFEGAICLLMAAPLWLGCAGIGGIIGYYLQEQARSRREAALLILLLSIVVPVLMGAETLANPTPQTWSVETTVGIDAPAKQVWNRVVEFPPLTEPTELLFRAGVAYPTSAVIAGHGVGAERRCRFSTGDFVEPIEVWDPPRLLRFSVTENPPPMRELSIYDQVEPPHLHGFLESKRGQFRLVPLPDGSTRLEGTTWYQHRMWPAGYWRIWSDYIIHRIHLRVLDHIAQLCHSERLSVRSTIRAVAPESVGSFAILDSPSCILPEFFP